MRYNTCGDYIQQNGEWYIYVAQLYKRRYEWLVALHEIIECYLCYWLGIKEQDIYLFDLTYRGDGEPGNEKDAPYHIQHRIATFFEWIFSKILFVNWTRYGQNIDEL